MKYAIFSGVSGGMGLATAKILSENDYFIYGLDINKPAENINNLKFIETNLRDIDSI